MDYRFVQLHYLTAYPGALLNRDDVGFAKRLPFGGYTRTRISSQCLKRHWRIYDGEDSLATIRTNGDSVPMSVRSRKTFDRFLYRPLVEGGCDEPLARALTEALMNALLGQSAKARAATSGDQEVPAPEVPETGQITVLGRPELESLLDQARALAAKISQPKEAAKVVEEWAKGDVRKNLQQMRLAMGLDAALFGRMVTSDILARGDAAIHVAHAFTVHEEEAETDYFSALDDFVGRGEEEALGAGHIGTTELTSGLYYGYVVVDVPLLVSNIEACPRKEWQTADRQLAAEVLRRLVPIIATVSPGAKLGSTAPYAWAQFVLAELGNSQPRTLANAFLQPVRRQQLLANAYKSLAAHLAELDHMYGTRPERRFAAVGPVEQLEPVLAASDRLSVPDLAAWVASRVEGSGND